MYFLYDNKNNNKSNNNNNGEIYEPHQLVYFSANRNGIPPCVQCKCHLLPHHFGRLTSTSGDLREMSLFIPKTLKKK